MNKIVYDLNNKSIERLGTEAINDETIQQISQAILNNLAFSIDELRYYFIVFMTPLWPEIFCSDDERKHSFEDTTIEYNRLLEFYARYGYQIVEIPKISIPERSSIFDLQYIFGMSNKIMLFNI